MKQLIPLLCFLLGVHSTINAQKNVFQWPLYLLDSIDFETTEPDIYLDTSSSNIWQIGPPQKNYFDSANSPANAILTDTINYYPNNNHSHFDLILGYHNSDIGMLNVFIQFDHKFETDTLKDGGYITVSHDNGSTWTNVVNDITGNYYSPGLDENLNLYESTSFINNGEPAFSGNSGGWITSRFAWYDLPVKSLGDSIIIRFNFYSDSISNNMDGWMVDNILIMGAVLPSSIQEQSTPEMVKVLNNPISNQLQLEIEEHYSEGLVELYTINGKKVLSQRLLHHQEPTIDLSNLVRGNYILIVKLDDRPFETKKIIKN